VRLGFTKLGKVRFVSHRDLARAFERALRTEQLPLAFTRGFSPRPKVSFGLALSVGHESRAEYLDVEFAEPVDVEGLPRSLSEALPEGVDVTGAGELRGRAPALQEAVTLVGYRLEVADVEAATLADALDRARAAEHLTLSTTRKGHAVVEDLRPALAGLALDGDGTIRVEATTRPRGLRPAELLTVIRRLAGAETDEADDRVLRTHQWIERDGARLEPLEADRAPRATARATSKGLPDDRRDHTGGDGLRAEAGTEPGSGRERTEVRRIA
jgi:radical SAM-linked protein